MGNRQRARWLLRQFHGLSSASAEILATSNDIYQTDSPYHLAYHARNRERGRMAGQIRMRERYLVHRSEWFDYLMVSRDEMAEIAAGTGWRVLRFLDSAGAGFVGGVGEGGRTRRESAGPPGLRRARGGPDG